MLFENNNLDQKNKKLYEKPQIEIIAFETESICVSGAETFNMDGFTY